MCVFKVMFVWEVQIWFQNRWGMGFLQSHLRWGIKSLCNNNNGPILHSSMWTYIHSCLDTCKLGLNHPKSRGRSLKKRGHSQNHFTSSFGPPTQHGHSLEFSRIDRCKSSSVCFDLYENDTPKFFFEACGNQPYLNLEDGRFHAHGYSAFRKIDHYLRGVRNTQTNLFQNWHSSSLWETLIKWSTNPYDVYIFSTSCKLIITWGELG